MKQSCRTRLFTQESCSLQTTAGFWLLPKTIFFHLITLYSPDKISVELNVELLSIPLSAQLLHGGTGGAEHQLQVRLGVGRSLWARWRWWGLRSAPVKTHAAPLGVPLQPVPLPWPEPTFSGHTAPAPVPLHVTLLAQKSVLFSTDSVISPA